MALPGKTAHVEVQIAMELTYSTAQTSIGDILVAATETGICMVSMGDSVPGLERMMKLRFPDGTPNRDDSAMSSVVKSVKAMIAGERSIGKLSFDLYGTDFQKKVWAELLRIPFGQTRAYAEIAARIGRPKAYRAVANACGANPVAIAIPCHRVVASGGKIGGYGGGLERKRKLLDKEGVHFPA